MRKSIPLISPDFNNIRESLKTYLRSQDQFNDYDFDGSVLSVLLDLLAYNSHLNIFYYNQLFNESYLSTAVTRKGVVNRALALGYIPQSKTSAVAVVNLSVSNLTTDTFTLPNNTVFFASRDSTTFEFRTNKEYEVSVINGTAEINNIELVEGRLYNYTLPVEESNRYPIPSKDVDISRLRVFNITPDGSASEEYTRADNIVSLLESNKVYFVTENLGGYYEVYFGDGLIGRKVESGRVQLSYNISSGSIANGVGVFSTNITSAVITVIQAASGGSEADSLQDIKNRAPVSYQTQNRAVTATDYESVIRDNFNFIDRLLILPGESVTPPTYGKVYIKLKPIDRLFPSTSEQNAILSFVKSKRVVAITPEIIENTFTFLNLDISLTFKNTTSRALKDIIIQQVTNLVKNYQSNITLENVFYPGPLTSTILQTSEELLDCTLTPTLTQSQKLGTSSVNKYNFNYQQAITPTSCRSEIFYISGSTTPFYLEDNGIGDMVLVSNNTSQKVGKVDYTKGTVELQLSRIESSNLGTSFSELTQSYLYLTAKPITGIVEGVNHFLQIDQVQVLNE